MRNNNFVTAERVFASTVYFAQEVNWMAHNEWEGEKEMLWWCVYRSRIFVFAKNILSLTHSRIHFFAVNAIDTESEKNRRKSIKIIYHSFFLLYIIFLLCSLAHRHRRRRFLLFHRWATWVHGSKSSKRTEGTRQYMPAFFL